MQKTVSAVLSQQYPIKTLMKIKTGSKNSKIGTPKVAKIVKPITKPTSEKKEKPQGKTRLVAKQEMDAIPAWVRESSEKKPKRAE